VRPLSIFRHGGRSILGISALAIGLPILLKHLGILDISYELLLIPFLISAVLFFMFRIDSRFFILFALAMLWLAPFLLVYKLQDAAEAASIYAYYALVMGVVLQLIEFKLDRKETVGIHVASRWALRKPQIFQLAVWTSLFILSFPLQLSSFVKAFSLYFAVSWAIQIISYMLLKTRGVPAGVEVY
jgi:hypothetical protein